MKKVFLIVLCSLFSLASFAQAKFDKLKAKADVLIEGGDYGLADKALEKFYTKVTKKLGKPNKYTPAYYLARASIKLGSGMIYDFESAVREAIQSDSALNNVNSVAHAILLKEVAALYLQSGSFQVARRHLEKSQQILEANQAFKDVAKAQVETALAEALTGQGYFNEALELLRSHERIFAGRAVKQESYVDEKGSLKTRRLSETDLTARFHDYANWFTVIANCYRLKGAHISADSAFTAGATWMERNLGNTDVAFVRNQYLFSRMLVENGLKTDQDFPRGLGFDRALNYMLSRHARSHYLSVQIYEQMLKRLLLQDNTSRYLNTKLEYEKMIEKSFPSGSIYSVRLQAVEFNRKLSGDKTRNLESEALKAISNNQNLPRNNATTAEVLDFLAQLGLEVKNYGATEKYLREIIDIRSALLGADAPETHLARLHLANFYLDYTNKIIDAGRIYGESFINVVQKQISPGHPDNLEILNHMAILYELTDNYARATAILKRAGEVARQKYSDTDGLFAVELTKIANLELKLGQYEEAEKDLGKALGILEEKRKDPDWQPAFVNAIETNAKLLGIKGLFDDAEDALDRSAKIISRSDNLVMIDELSTAQELASLFIQLGRYSATEQLLSKLIPEYEKLYGSTSLRLIEPLTNQGRLLLAKGDYTDAEKVAQRANQIAMTVYGEKSTKTAPTQRLLGDIDYTIGDYENAEINFNQALASQQKQFGRKHIEVAKSLAQLGLTKFYKGDNRQEVEKILIEARDIIGEKLSKDNPQYADILKSVAFLYLSEKKFEIAFSSLTQAESIWRTRTGSKNNINLASIYALTGDVYYQQKNYPKAEEFYNKGKDIYERFFSDKHPEYVKVLSKLSKVYYMQKDFRKAKKNIEEALNNYESFIKLYFPALSEREKAKYWNTIRGDFEFYNTLAFSKLEDFRDLSGKVYNYQLLTKALLLSSSIKVRERIMNSKDNELIASYNLWVQKKEFLTSALSMSASQLTENGINTTQLTGEVEDLEKQLSQKSELFGQGFESKRVTYESVQKSIGKNDVAIELVRYRHFNHTFTDSVVYVGLYVRNDNSRPKVIHFPEGYRMETRFFKYYRNCIISKLPDQFSYKVFWEPIQTEIGQYATVYISPDGVYNQLNLEAIPTPDGKYVIDNSNIVIVNNTKDLFIRKQTTKQTVAVPASINNATMVGNPTFYVSAGTERNITDLPGTEKEVAELDDLLKQKGWKTDEYTENNATEETVKDLQSPNVLHIATHGFYTKIDPKTAGESLTENEAQLAENPLMKSGLLLRGAGDVLSKTKFNYNLESGILTAYEAMNLNLDKTDLVVLSACETGLGEISNGEGVYGLQRAFLVAGAKVLIMSMFKVDDEATQKLILNFYRKWLATGNKRQSFIDAKKELRVDYAEPIYWGAFMMIGLD